MRDDNNNKEQQDTRTVDDEENAWCYVSQRLGHEGWGRYAIINNQYKDNDNDKRWQQGHGRRASDDKENDQTRYAAKAKFKAIVLDCNSGYATIITWDITWDENNDERCNEDKGKWWITPDY
jgi:hypothetical protein